MRDHRRATHGGGWCGTILSKPASRTATWGLYMNILAIAPLTLRPGAAEYSTIAAHDIVCGNVKDRIQQMALSERVLRSYFTGFAVFGNRRKN